MILIRGSHKSYKDVDGGRQVRQSSRAKRYAHDRVRPVNRSRCRCRGDESRICGRTITTIYDPEHVIPSRTPACGLGRSFVPTMVPSSTPTKGRTAARQTAAEIYHILNWLCTLRMTSRTSEPGAGTPGRASHSEGSIFGAVTASNLFRTVSRVAQCEVES